MLETTLATTFVPGANLKGQVAGGNWMFLRPSVSAEHVVCVGAPPLATLTTLASFSQVVTIVGASSQQVQTIRAASAKAGLTNVHLIVMDGGVQLALSPGSVDLIIVFGWRNVWRFHRDQALRRELQSSLKIEGILYYEYYGLLEPLLHEKLSQGLPQDDIIQQTFWLTPLRGEMHTAVPIHDGLTTNYFKRHRLYSPTFHFDRLKRAWKLVKGRRSALGGGTGMDVTPRREVAPPARGANIWPHQAGAAAIHRYQCADQRPNTLPLLGQWNQRRGVFVGGPAAKLANHPPHYLQALAAASGIQLDNYRWGLSARGEYSSRKLLFFLFDPANPAPEAPPTYIIKMVRDPAFNARLENEQRALSNLYAQGIGERDTLPQVVFSGHHAGLAIVGETALQGAPFRSRSQFRPDCPYAHAAIEWFLTLGAVTANPSAASPAEVASNIEKLFIRFRELYQLTAEQLIFLERQLDVLSSQPTVPLVFQHGDPGPWNMLVTPRGDVALLDWEAAEPQGMPLWDLFYFLRSYCIDAARARGIRPALTGFAQQFLSETPHSALVINSVKRYCAHVDLSPQLIEPLFYTCWMHRALKEATRMAPSKLEDGHYANLLRLCIAHRNSVTLESLFAG